ncbi:unnamed protein product [Adineta ricciae]|uniref:Uncharacterized protein n=1 Tax=Adineta ricciae TaxID=249248 RepID=A0A816HB08_ADIRI|nr:unnamed protein product [Adineta ricciae]
MFLSPHHRFRPTFAPEEIYKANCRTEFIHMISEAHGSNMARLLADLSIDSATCLLKVDVFAEIGKSRKLLSNASVDYVFEDGTTNIRVAVRVNIETLIEQMRQVSRESPERHCARGLGQ